MVREILTTNRKALAINLDEKRYGTFAEIGAGQEVARHFFQAGAAAGTIAKTMSAYDMIFSDSIYGKVVDGRYVSKSRLKQMLEHEYQLLKERLWDVRTEETTFFVFADTVTTKGYTSRKSEAHGWLGVRYQKFPHKDYNDVVIHVRLLDDDYVMEQDILGIVGVNLLYGVLYYDDLDEFVESLKDNIAANRVEIDMIECSGPDLAYIDNRLLSLRLVNQGLTRAVMFDQTAQVRQASNMLHHTPVLVQRGGFRPVSHVNIDMTRCALKYFEQDSEVDPTKLVTVMEISLSKLYQEGEIDTQDFLDRVDLLCSLGNAVLISDFTNYYQFAEYIARNSKSAYAFVMPLAGLRQILDEDEYAGVSGGMLEGLGRLFSKDGRAYVYPEYDEESKDLVTAENLSLPVHLKFLYKHLLENQYIVDLKECDLSYSQYHASKILELIRRGSAEWEDLVPERVATLIKDKKLWGYK